MNADIEWVREYLQRCVPKGVSLATDGRDPFQIDECRWFRTAVENQIIQLCSCGPECAVKKKRRHPRKHELIDEFIVPHQQENRRCHLLWVTATEANLSREYIPHIAAYARAVVGLGYAIQQSSFSKYQKFRKDLIHKRAGEGYETDAEFYDAEGNIYLHVETKRSPTEVAKVVEAMKSCGALDVMPEKAAKEIEYTLDLAPRFLWIVGPGSVDPEKHVFEVAVQGLNARFSSVSHLPPPPGG